jgi:hypothetical protein
LARGLTTIIEAKATKKGVKTCTTKFVQTLEDY